MGVLLIAKCKATEVFDVPFVKETIQWYKSGELYHVVRVFIRLKSGTFSGVRLILDRAILSVDDRCSALKSLELMGLVKEEAVQVLPDQTVVLDGHHYLAIAMKPTFKNIGRFGGIQVRPSKPIKVVDQDILLAFMFCARVEDRKYNRTTLVLFGAVELDTYVLMPPSTVTIEACPIPQERLSAVLGLEASAVTAHRYELWIAVEGPIEATSVDSTQKPKRNRAFKGASVLERHYGIPPLTKGWEVAIDFRKSSQWFNEAVKCSFKHNRFFLVLAWIFGLATLLGLLVAIGGLL